jgi:predicted amidohydrolase YtcJ
VLHHRTGHAAVLNSAALEALGIPHHPDGLLVDRHDLLRGVPPLPEKELLASLDVVLDELASVGIVSVTDATHTNDRTALELLGRPPRVAVKAMVGWDRLDGVHYGAEVGGVGVGAAKIMPAREGGALTATGDKALLAFAVASAHHAGFPVAIHVMDIDTMADALDALSRSSPPLGTRDRIEHCSLALPEQLDALARLRVDVVTQPSFINRRAAKYREQISAVEQEWLWPLASLGKRGVPVRYSSDAPVVLPRPMEWLAAAMRREINSQEEVSWVDALKSAAAGPLLAEKQGSLVIYDRNAEAVRRLR